MLSAVRCHPSNIVFQNTYQVLVDSGITFFGGNRIDYRLKLAWKDSADLEFLWNAGPGTERGGTDRRLLTHILGEHYGCVDTFDFENHGTVPITTTNVAARAQAYAGECRRRSVWYKHGLLLVPHGDDMKWQRGDWQRQNMTLIMDYINGHPELGIKIHWATIAEYAGAVASVDGLSARLGKYDGDFFPYAFKSSGRPYSKPNMAASAHACSAIDISTS